jgi:RNA polymerase sigma factor (sigma-70 family)
MPNSAPVSIPAGSGSRRASALPRDPGRATETLYRRHGTTVFRYAWHLLGSREDAEDATQATFLAVHRALAFGTAVIEPGAWVLGIARNECTGRLRGMARRPTPGTLGDDLTAVAGGSVESAAEVRDEMRTAQQTLMALPEPERDAFLLREWLGLATPEVALALGVEAGYVEYLTARARRSLVLAVGGLEAPIGCAETRTALAAHTLGRAAKVHLLRCPMCRGVRRALRPRAAVPAAAPAVAERLAGVLPGFGVGAGGGGGLIAALTTKAATVPVITKAAALVAATLLAGTAVGTAIHTSHPAHHRSLGPSLGRGGESSAPAAKDSGAGRAPLVYVAATSSAHHARTATIALTRSTVRASRGGPAGRGDHPSADRGGRDHGSSGSRNDGAGHVSSSDDGKGEHASGGDNARPSGKSDHASGGDDGSSSATSGDHAGRHDGKAHTTGDGVTGDGDEGTGTAGDASSGDGASTHGDASSGDGSGGDASAAGVTGASDGPGDGATASDSTGSSGNGEGDSGQSDSPVTTDSS